MSQDDVAGTNSGNAEGSVFDLLERKADGNYNVTRIAPGERFTDTGNAKRYAYQHGNKVRWVHLRGEWLVWDGNRWKPDTLCQAQALAQETTATICAEAVQFSGDSKEKALKHALRSESAAARGAMVELAKSEPGIAIDPESLDTNPMLLNVQNGTINLNTGIMRDPNPKDLITHISKTAFHGEGSLCPIWHSFLDTIFGGDQELISYIQRAVGYSLTGKVSEQCLFFLYGTGSNGKTTLMEAIQYALGEYASTTRAETLLAKERDSSDQYYVANLVGVRLVIASELDEGRRFAEAKIKDLTGGDTITARFPFGRPFQFNPEFKLWIFGNHKPDIRGTDEGIWRRIHLIPFKVQISKQDRDLDLGDKLQKEAAGILNWALQGCLEWQAQGLNPPKAVTDATKDYRSEQDVLGTFLEERCDISNKEYEIKANWLYTAYREWANSTGEFAVSNKRFSNALIERGFLRVKASTIKYKGLRLNTQDDPRYLDN
ncbi:MAG: hypothetical protein IIB68_10340 [Proteobacteria bacterium]|nr:hypothetical protein [Pseudomonadota bacterium]